MKTHNKNWESIYGASRSTHCWEVFGTTLQASRSVAKDIAYMCATNYRQSIGTSAVWCAAWCATKQ